MLLSWQTAYFGNDCLVMGRSLFLWKYAINRAFLELLSDEL